MQQYSILLFIIVVNFQLGFGQNLSDSDTLVFEYDESYLTVYKHTPDCYYIADLPIGKGFCFQFEKEIKDKYLKKELKNLRLEKVLNIRNYVYRFNEENSDNGIITFIDVDVFVKHFDKKHIYFKKGNVYIKVGPLVSVE